VVAALTVSASAKLKLCIRCAAMFILSTVLLHVCSTIQVTGPYFETPYAKAPSATVDGTTGAATATGTAPGSRGNAYNKTNQHNPDSGSEAEDDEAAFGRRVRAGRPT
jgi:hypothetical protein